MTFESTFLYLLTLGGGYFFAGCGKSGANSLKDVPDAVKAITALAFFAAAIACWAEFFVLTFNVYLPAVIRLFR